MENNPALFYSERLIELNKNLDTLLLRQKKTGWLRFITIAGGAIAAWQVYTLSPLITIITILFTISAFLFLVSSDITNNKSIRITKNLIQINLEEQESLLHHFYNFPEGKQFDIPGHSIPMTSTSQDMHPFSSTPAAPVLNRDRLCWQHGY